MQSHSDKNPCVPLKEAGGPLHSYIPDFTDSLADRGYSKECIAYKFRLVRAFDQWMRKRQIKMEGFTEKRIQEFIRHRAKRYSKQRGDAATLRSLLKRLQEANVISAFATDDEPARPAAAQVRAIPDGAARSSTEIRAAISLPHAAVSCLSALQMAHSL